MNVVAFYLPACFCTSAQTRHRCKEARPRWQQSIKPAGGAPRFLKTLWLHSEQKHKVPPRKLLESKPSSAGLMKIKFCDKTISFPS